MPTVAAATPGRALVHDLPCGPPNPQIAPSGMIASQARDVWPAEHGRKFSHWMARTETAMVRSAISASRFYSRTRSCLGTSCLDSSAAAEQLHQARMQTSNSICCFIRCLHWRQIKLSMKPKPLPLHEMV